jgi:hypothetical protein
MRNAVVLLFGPVFAVVVGVGEVRAQALTSQPADPLGTTIQASASLPLVSPLDRPYALPPLPRIEPGTRVADRAPDGWHLVLKSCPRVTTGDLDKASSQTLELAQLFFTAVIVHPEPDPARPQHFRLGRVAVGLGSTKSGDRILTRDTAESLGVRLGIFEAMALLENENQLKNVVQVARSATMAMVDYPLTMLRGNTHVPVILRHAYLVDPRDGRLFALLWTIDKSGREYRLAEGPLLLLEPNQVLDAQLHVDATKFFLGAPSPEAFAITSLPAGTALPPPPQFAALAASRHFTPNTAYQLELGLWDALFPNRR